MVLRQKKGKTVRSALYLSSNQMVQDYLSDKNSQVGSFVEGAS